MVQYHWCVRHVRFPAAYVLKTRLSLNRTARASKAKVSLGVSLKVAPRVPTLFLVAWGIWPGVFFICLGGRK